jgi:hypothetical protein
MPHVEFWPRSFQLVKRPICPKCREEMWLVRIVPADTRTDKHTFECPTCDIAKVEVVARAS